jgi:hypothetical protein
VGRTGGSGSRGGLRKLHGVIKMTLEEGLRMTDGDTLYQEKKEVHVAEEQGQLVHSV